MQNKNKKIRCIRCATLTLILGISLGLPAYAADDVLVGVGTAPAAETGARNISGTGDESNSAALTGVADETENSAASGAPALGDADYNGGLKMLGSHSTLTVDGTLEEYEWVKSNMAGRFMPYVIAHAEGNPNVIHFLYEYGHDAKSPDSFEYTAEEKKVFSQADSPAEAGGEAAQAADNPAETGGEAAAQTGGSASNVPLLMQWDWRWGYFWYGGGPAGLTGCAPTCMTMIGLGLTGDESYTVPAMCQYAIDKGYWVDGQGTSWSLVTDAFPNDPISCQNISVDEGSIASALNQDMPVLINVGVGKFSAVGHFMVLTGLDPDGRFFLNDPNNLENSSKSWAWEDLATEIQAAWAYRLQR